MFSCVILIRFRYTNIHMYLQYKKCRLYPLAIVLTSLMGSVYSPVYADDAAHPQTFVVTAYYSPLPDQCCYFRGSYEEEIAFNGHGIRGADGTGVYPGMIAAPPAYSFGTVISLPGVGVGTVHDRGGRIIEWGEDIHRIDLWMGYGEEGLARALEWGARTVKGTVYPLGVPGTPNESMDLKTFASDTSNLAALPKSDPTKVMTDAALGEEGYHIRMLQSALKTAGYFNDPATGRFGPATQTALKEFLSDYDLPGDGSFVDTVTATTLAAANSFEEENLPNVPVGLKNGSLSSDVRQVQKLLRYLGYYRGRTDGVFDQDLRQSLVAFQVSKGVIVSQDAEFAGHIGPGTKAALLLSWKAKNASVKAKVIAMKLHVSDRVKTEALPSKVLGMGDNGEQVKQLQRALHDLGYLPAKDVTGTFGARTAAALLAYQTKSNIVTSEKQKGAGVFGPTTRKTLLTDISDSAWQKVRADGIGSL